MKRLAIASLLVLCAAARPALACPVAVKAVAVENAAVVAVPMESVVAAPVVVAAAPVVATVAVPAVSVVTVPAVIEQVVKVKVKAKRQFRTPVRSLLFR